MQLRGGAYLGQRGTNAAVQLSSDATLATYFGTLGVRHFLGEGWAVDLQLPVGMVRFSPGQGRAPDRLSGLGDLQAGLRYDLSALWGAGGYSPSVTLRLGLGLPSGHRLQTEMQAGVSPNLLATGYATFSAQAQVWATQFISTNVAWQAWLTASGPVGRAADGIRPGVQLGYGLGGLWRAHERLALSARLAGQHISQADSQTQGTLLNSGVDVWAAEVDLTWFLSPRVAVNLGGRVPVYTHVNGKQIIETFSLGLGATLTFGATDDDDDHDGDDGHDHGADDAHDHGHDGATEASGLTHDAARSGAPDVSDLAVGGQTFTASTAAVPHKLTVIDYWASWCGPCEQLTRELTALAGQHAELAVRRVEVPDFDCPVAEEHLADVQSLPTVWLLAPDGTKTVLAGTEVKVILQNVRNELRKLSARD